MKTYTLKSVVRRGSMLVAALVVAGSAILPATSASADALNPLTDRSLTLSSSAPGWDFLDGSGNTTYAAPNSGANGQKTGNTYSFKVSSDSTSTPVKAITFQYCTTPAGTCTAPGNNARTGSAGSYVRGADSTVNKTSDLNVTYAAVGGAPANGEVTAPVFDTTSGAITTVPNRNGSQGHFIVYTKNSGATTWTQNTGWAMATTNDENGINPTSYAQDGNGTTKNNYITLTNAAGGLQLIRDGEVKVVFFGTDANYITNPGAGAFFVKINTWNHASDRVEATNLIDGGVTVANVMNLGISIQTKVLETMDFSVGTVDPYTLSAAQLTTADPARYPSGSSAHGTCDPILTAMDSTDPTRNTLQLGQPSGEYSLSTDVTYSTHSYFRLSSNASAGATVYYSGVTLSNTVGDVISPIGPTKTGPSRGTEQFGLALANNTVGDSLGKINYKTEREATHQYENGADNEAAGIAALNDWTYTASPTNPGEFPYNNDSGATGVDPTWVISGGQKFPQLTVATTPSNVQLAAHANYNQGVGVVNPVTNIYNAANVGESVATEGAKFAFDQTSNLIPVAIASESTNVVDCASAKVRYIANIAATTPAGIYTTKINFIAAPQY